MNKRWEFTMDEHAGWHWRAIDADTGLVLEQAGGDFKTLFACVRDAERHGYALPTPRDGWYAQAA